MEDRVVADVVCPLCGLPIEVAQQFIRPNDEQEYMTVRCMADHYLTIKVEDADLLVVGEVDAEDAEIIQLSFPAVPASDEEEPGLE